MVTSLQFNVADAAAVSHEMIRWASACRKQGTDPLSIAMAMVTTGAMLATGSEDDGEYRRSWVAWLRGVADDIEANKPTVPTGRP